jgi:cell division protein FtsI (penicillin-binding protein 3)
LFFSGGFFLWKKKKNHSEVLDSLRTRIVFTIVFGLFLFGAIIFKLADIMIFNNREKEETIILNANEYESALKADITDRNGVLLATSVATSSCFIDPSSIIDSQETAEKLSELKGLPTKEKIFDKIKNKRKKFVWLIRHISPKIQQQIMNLGLPGVFFKKDYKRVYPLGSLFSHIIGACDIDGAGLCGLEKNFDQNLIIKGNNFFKLTLSLDLRIQSIIREELLDSIEKYSAEGGNAILMNINGEVLAIVSLPDFDPNSLQIKMMKQMFNRNTLGVFEPGSVLKIVNVAIALETKKADLNSIFDASVPVKLGRFLIKDFKGKNRPLTLTEAFVFSSNIAAVKIAQTFGPKIQKMFMEELGLFEKVSLEVPEIGKTIKPKIWHDSTFVTASYGYGISVSPINLLRSVATIIGDGYLVQPTIVKGKFLDNKKQKIISASTSEKVRSLMRAVVKLGTARKAEVEGAQIFGKTGTAYKISKKGYGNEKNRARITTFIGGFPTNKPEYVMIIMLDNPKPVPESFGYATAGWNVTKTAGNIFQKIIPILRPCLDPESDLIVTKYMTFKPKG